MRTLAGCTLMLSACTTVPNVDGYLGSADEIEAAVSAARQCGIRDLRIGPEGGRTRLFLSRSVRPRELRCLHQWVSANSRLDTVITVQE